MMQQEARIAPAKINLTLKVLGRREDGFHELESLMVALDPDGLGDVLRFEQSESYELHCDCPGVPVDETNLISMAVRQFEQHVGTPCRWKISLEKNIPHGAGLGGGSSDAATTLLALNELEGAGFSRGQLAEMGAALGSDIPFFIYQQACMVRGRGEIVEPVDPAALSGLPGTEILLLKPSFGVSTPDAYRHCMEAELLAGVDYSAQQMPWGEIVNDLEKAVFFKHRFLAEMKVWLMAQPDVTAAMMSGSGSTMMAFPDNGEDALDLLARARRELDPGLWGCRVAVQPL